MDVRGIYINAMAAAYQHVHAHGCNQKILRPIGSCSREARSDGAQPARVGMRKARPHYAGRARACDRGFRRNHRKLALRVQPRRCRHGARRRKVRPGVDRHSSARRKRGPPQGLPSSLPACSSRRRNSRGSCSNGFGTVAVVADAAIVSVAALRLLHVQPGEDHVRQMSLAYFILPRPEYRPRHYASCTI